MMKIRNIIMIVTAVAVIQSCGSKKTVTTGNSEAQEGAEKIQSLEDRMNKPAELFALALSQNLNAHVNSALLDIEGFTYLEPEKVKDVSQESLAAKYLTPMHNRFHGNLDAVRKAFKDNGFASDSIGLSGFKIFEKEGDQPFPVVNLYLESEGGKATVPVSFMDYNGKIYFLEILKTTGLFKK